MTDRRTAPRSWFRWVWIRTAGAIAGGGVAVLICLPVIWEAGAWEVERLAPLRTWIDPAFVCLSAVGGACVGVLPWLASRRREFGADACASAAALGEAAGCLLGWAVAEGVSPLVGGAALWVLSGAVAGAAAGTVAEILALEPG